MIIKVTKEEIARARYEGKAIEYGLLLRLYQE